jgi:hypothetical protein
MQLAFQICAYLVGLSLELAIMVVLLRGQWKRYPFVFIYLIGDFLTTVLEIEPALGYGGGTEAARLSFTNLYWWNERVMELLTFLLVISLVYRATAHLRPRRTILLFVVLGTLLLASASLLYHLHFDGNSSMGKLMTPFTRDMNFLAAILDLGLWATLIGVRQKDYKLLMISGALGIQFTGVAIGQALRDMTSSQILVTLLGDFMIMAYITCSYIWWQAFRMPVTAAASAGRQTPSPTPQA